jgi:hypothetical protein
MCDAGPLATYTSYIVSNAKARACAILAEFNKAQTELVGKAAILTDGKAGTVDEVWLDEFHGLRISIIGHEGKWPVSSIKLAQTDDHPFSKAMPAMLTTDEEREVWMRAP